MSVTWPDVMKFDIPENAVIFDVGGYKGDWAQIAMNNYKNPKIYVFEPVKRFYDEIVSRYQGMENIKVYNFGLSDDNRDEEISIEGDSSSVFKNNGNTENIKLKNIIEFLFEEKIFHVDLIKINIEGEEYRLMEHLTSNPELNIFDNYLIQFHGFIDNYVERRDKIAEKLSVYYNRIFNYDFIFEGWSMKPIQTINCFGDSHISIFRGSKDLIDENKMTSNKNFNSFRFGPYLAYNLPDKKNVVDKIRELDNENNILLCFGEIDCRAQIKNICENNKNYKDVIDDVISRYFSVIDQLGNKKIITFSITPELKEEPHWYYYKDNLEAFDCPKGTLMERSEYKTYFNQQVKEESENRNFKYISIYDYVVGNELYYLDDIHLSPEKVFYLIKREFLKNGFES